MIEQINIQFQKEIQVPVTISGQTILSATTTTEVYYLKKSYRGLMLFEEMTGKNMDEMKESVSDILTLFYCLLKASNREKYVKTFDEFLNDIDESPDSVEVFTTYLKGEAEKNTKSPDKKKQENH